MGQKEPRKGVRLFRTVVAGNVWTAHSLLRRGFALMYSRCSSPRTEEDYLVLPLDSFDVIPALGLTYISFAQFVLPGIVASIGRKTLSKTRELKVVGEILVQCLRILHLKRDTLNFGLPSIITGAGRIPPTTPTTLPHDLHNSRNAGYPNHSPYPNWNPPGN